MYSILVIEDNDQIRENTAEILEMAGYKVFTADNGKRGVELAQAEKPDVVVCDITMPVLDGYGVLHLLHKNQKTRNIPFIFLSAKAERSDLRKGMDLGADDYISKPFEESELLSAIETRIKKKNIIAEDYENNAIGVRSFLNDVGASGLTKHLTESYDTIIYQKKQTLYQECKRPKHVFYLVRGKVKSVRRTDDGKEYIGELYGEGDFIGHVPILEDKNYDDDAIVMEESEVLMLPKENFLELLNGEPSIARKFISLLTRDIHEKQDRLLHLAYGSLRKRVAKALLEIDEKFNKENSQRNIDISRDDIAHYVGTATESLIRTLSDFKHEKLICIVDGRITLLERVKLLNMLN